MTANLVERLEGRALMSATVTRDVQEFALEGPAALVEGVEVIDLAATGVTTITAVSNGQRSHTQIREVLTGAGPGLETGNQYALVSDVRAVENFSQVRPGGVAQFVVHTTVTSETGETVRQLIVAHFQVLPNGEVRESVKVKLT